MVLPSVLHTDEGISCSAVATCPIGSGNPMICGEAADSDSGDECVVVDKGPAIEPSVVHPDERIVCSSATTCPRCSGNPLI